MTRAPAMTDAQRKALDYARKYGRITTSSAVIDSRGHHRTVLVTTLQALERMGHLKHHSEFGFNGWVPTKDVSAAGAEEE